MTSLCCIISFFQSSFFSLLYTEHALWIMFKGASRLLIIKDWYDKSLQFDMVLKDAVIPLENMSLQVAAIIYQIWYYLSCESPFYLKWWKDNWIAFKVVNQGIIARVYVPINLSSSLFYAYINVSTKTNISIGPASVYIWKWITHQVIYSLRWCENGSATMSSATL